jgi:hypothetical protein
MTEAILENAGTAKYTLDTILHSSHEEDEARFGPIYGLPISPDTGFRYRPGLPLAVFRSYHLRMINTIR